MNLKETMNALNLGWEDDPVLVSEKISENFDLGKKSIPGVYCNPNEAAICYILMWEQSHGYSKAEREAYEATDIQAISKAYFGD